MSLTNVTFPDAETKALRSAVQFYGYENLNQFFRVCARALIEHHRRGYELSSPLRFQVNGAIKQPPVRL